ncbi:MAG TPA: hypothetical protein VLK33_12130 [Terriglobales bacterium]|nr:hypothetical protein [Terriglobales bacterium]
MTKYIDVVEDLRLKVEGFQPLKARFKQKTFVRHMNGDTLVWEGDVYAFGLSYANTQSSLTTKEEKASWQLAGPTTESLKAAENRGVNLRKLSETGDRKTEVWRKSKLAYAWSSPIKGSDKRKINVVLQEGDVKSPADAVKAAMGKGKGR